MVLIYKENPKHKRGVQGEGPPRWNPDPDSLCPDDLGQEDAELLLRESVPGADAAHPDRRARYAIDTNGRFFKGYCEGVDDQSEYWHGFPVREDKVRIQIPARVLREFKRQGRITSPRYRKLLGSGR